MGRRSFLLPVDETRREDFGRDSVKSHRRAVVLPRETCTHHVAGGLAPPRVEQEVCVHRFVISHTAPHAVQFRLQQFLPLPPCGLRLSLPSFEHLAHGFLKSLRLLHGTRQPLVPQFFHHACIKRLIPQAFLQPVQCLTAYECIRVRQVHLDRPALGTALQCTQIITFPVHFHPNPEELVEPNAVLFQPIRMHRVTAKLFQPLLYAACFLSCHVSLRISCLTSSRL